MTFMIILNWLLNPKSGRVKNHKTSHKHHEKRSNVACDNDDKESQSAIIATQNEGYTTYVGREVASGKFVRHRQGNPIESPRRLSP